MNQDLIQKNTTYKKANKILKTITLEDVKQFFKQTKHKAKTR